MFYDSDIAKGFKLSKTKCSYYVNYGLAPFYKKKLIVEVNASPFFTLHFDESMNKVLQTEQMDGCVRFWSDECNQVKTHYLDSQFFNHPNSTNILQGIDSTIKPLHKQKMIGLGMDGPTTNWAVLKLIQEDRKELEFPLVENIGSCGLHVVPRALQTGVTESSWPLKKVLKAMWHILHDSHARKDVFVNINQSEKLALRFCLTRWTENEDIASRAIQVWDHYNALMQHFSTLCASKPPKNNSSYDTLKEHRHDKLMKLKFKAFKDVAHKMNLFLTVFQTDAPMIPFLSDTL